MDVVVRTPHGDADIEIVSAPADTTLGDLLAAVTGQAPPVVARVDGRVVHATQRLDSVALRVGSIVDSRPTDDSATTGSIWRGSICLAQLTGRGAGTVSTLPVGRYRIGSGRRLNAEELADAPVETPAFELRVRPGEEVTVTPGPRAGGPSGVLTPTLDGKLFDRTLTWSSGRLNVGGRVFELIEPDRFDPPTPLPPADARGAIPFHRAPILAPAPELLAVTAMQRAVTAGNGLWTRRPADAGAYRLPFGLMPDGVTEAEIDFQRHRGVAVVGSDRFGAALARTLLVEATTAHGPSDLVVVIASTPERLGQWDWAKWLPHARRGDPSARPLLLTEHHDLAEWADGAVVQAAPSPPTTVPPAPPGGDAPTIGTPERADDPGPTHPWAAPTHGPTPSDDPAICLLVLDDLSLWSRRDSPLRRVLVDPPPHLRIIALCGGMHEAPGMCSALVEERTARDVFDTAETTGASASLFGSLATLHQRHGQTADVDADIRPALVTPSCALTAALAIASLDDLDIAQSTSTPTSLAPPTLAELVDIQMATSGPDDSLMVTLGLIDAPSSEGIGGPPMPRRPVRVDLASARVTLISAPDRETHDTVVAAAILGATAVRRPDQLAILTVGSNRPAWHSEVPQLAGHVDRSTPDDPARLVHRVAHVLTSEPGLEVVVVIEDAFDEKPIATGRQALASDMLTGMLELAESLPRVHVVMTTDLDPRSVDDSVRSRAGIEITLEGPADHPRGQVASGQATVPFIGPTRTAHPSRRAETTIDDPSRRLRIQTSVFGRSMTPLERRISRNTPRVDDGELVDPAMQRVALRVAEGAGHTTGAAHGNLLPPPLATSISHIGLLADHPGDGVPIGLLDRPERAVSDAYWWQPGPEGSILAIGSPRSGMTQLIDLVTVGIAARLSPDDVRVYAIEPLPQRRRAIDALPHCVSVVTTDEPHAVRGLIATVVEILESRRGSHDHDEPAIALLVGDLARLRRWLPDDAVDETLEQLAIIGTDGPGLGVNLICVATRVDDLGPLVRLSGDRLVGTVSEATDRTRLGVPAPGPADRHTGRCWSVNSDRRVQLATPPDSVELEIARLAPESARSRRVDERTTR